MNYLMFMIRSYVITYSGINLLGLQHVYGKTKNI